MKDTTLRPINVNQVSEFENMAPKTFASLNNFNLLLKYKIMPTMLRNYDLNNAQSTSSQFWQI
jgi:hypothetical protein